MVGLGWSGTKCAVPLLLDQVIGWVTVHVEFTWGHVPFEVFVFGLWRQALTMVRVYFVFPLTVRVSGSGRRESQIFVGVKPPLLGQALGVLFPEPKRVTSVQGHDELEVVERGVQGVQIVAVLVAGAEHVLSIANVVAIYLSYLC